MSLEQQVGLLVEASNNLTSFTENILTARVAKVYETTVTAATSGTILAATHGCGISVSLKAFADGYEERLSYQRDGSGNITWESSPPFTGTLEVTGVLN
jgi:hypothetical protein